MRIHILQIAKATLAAVIFSLTCVLIFSLIITFASVPDGAVKIVSQALKIISVAFGGILFLRGGRALIKGACYGVLAIICTYLLYGIIASSLELSPWFVLEIALGGVSGGISGIIGANIKKQ